MNVIQRCAQRIRSVDGIPRQSDPSTNAANAKEMIFHLHSCHPHFPPLALQKDIRQITIDVFSGRIPDHVLQSLCGLKIHYQDKQSCSGKQTKLYYKHPTAICFLHPLSPLKDCSHPSKSLNFQILSNSYGIQT